MVNIISCWSIIVSLGHKVSHRVIMSVLKKVENLKTVAIKMGFDEELDFKSNDAINKISEFWMKKADICTWQPLKKTLTTCEEFEAVDDIELLEQYNHEGTYYNIFVSCNT